MWRAELCWIPRIAAPRRHYSSLLLQVSDFRESSAVKTLDTVE